MIYKNSMCIGLCIEEIEYYIPIDIMVIFAPWKGEWNEVWKGFSSQSIRGSCKRFIESFPFTFHISGVCIFNSVFKTNRVKTCIWENTLKISGVYFNFIRSVLSSLAASKSNLIHNIILRSSWISFLCRLT